MTSELMINHVYHGEEETMDLAPLDVTLNRRTFLQALGAGLLISIAPQTTVEAVLYQNIKLAEY